MKIIKKMGERLPRWMTTSLRSELRTILTFTGAGRALAAGSGILVRRGWAKLGGHVTGWERPAALGIGTYVALYAAWHAPGVMRFAVPAAIVAWCAAALWHAPPELIDDPQPEEQPAEGTPHVFAQWLLDLIDDRSGIHLRELYPAMRTLPGQEDRDNGQLRAALSTLGVPVTRSLRLGGVAGRSGVARADVEALLPSTGEPGGDFDGDAGQTADSPNGEQAGEWLEST